MKVVPRLVLLGIAVVTAAACGGSSRDVAADPTPPRFTGEMVCRDCDSISTMLTLFPGDSFLLEETYRGSPQGDADYKSRGTYATLGDAVNPSAGRILLISPNMGQSRRFRQLGDTALRELTREGQEYESSEGRMLTKVP